MRVLHSVPLIGQFKNGNLLGGVNRDAPLVEDTHSLSE